MSRWNNSQSDRAMTIPQSYCPRTIPQRYRAITIPQSYCQMTILQVFSRVVSMEEAIAYTSCSEAGRQMVVGRISKFLSGCSGRCCFLGKGRRVGDSGEGAHRHAQVVHQHSRQIFFMPCHAHCSGRMTSALRQGQKEENE